MSTSFSTLGIDQRLVKGLNEMGIKSPTSIQEQAIPQLLNENGDFVGQARTGTGKTAAYALPLLHKIDTKSKKIQGLILSPTRELGLQIAKQIFKFTKYYDRIFTECVYGGARIEPQIQNLKRPTQILVATPGRLIELLDKNIIDLSAVETLILDEADEMLSLGFKDDLERILSELYRVKNKWLFSATMPSDIEQMIGKHLSASATRIEIKGKSGVNKNVEHQFLICDDREKLPILVQFLNTQGKQQGIIFCKKKASATELIKQLQHYKISAEGIHGDLRQKEREKAMRNFRKNQLRVLVATDLAARGIDVQDLAFVVHYELPSTDEYYIHRSGRTGRGGKRGTAISLVNRKEVKQLRYLEKKAGISFSQIRRMK